MHGKYYLSIYLLFNELQTFILLQDTFWVNRNYGKPNIMLFIDTKILEHGSSSLCNLSHSLQHQHTVYTSIYKRSLTDLYNLNPINQFSDSFGLLSIEKVYFISEWHYPFLQVNNQIVFKKPGQFLIFCTS